MGRLVESKPMAFQMTDSGKQEIACEFALNGDGTFGFNVGSFDSSKPLIIDPEVQYGDYVGGSKSDQAYALTADAVGNLYIAGSTDSTDFATTGIGTKWSSDVFVSKISADGSVAWTTYIGGRNGNDTAYGIAVDASENLYLTGETLANTAGVSSDNFPVTGPDTVPNAGNAGLERDAFIAKLNKGGASLAWSTFLGGYGADIGSSVSVDPSGNVYVTGYIGNLNDFETKESHLNFTQVSGQTFVTRVNAGGGSFAWTTLIGGTSGSMGYGLALDTGGNVYVTGYTRSSDFQTLLPISDGAYDGSQFNRGSAYDNEDGFLVKLSAGAGSVTFSTYLGGKGDDFGYSVAVDGAGSVYVAGTTSYALSGAASDNFPTTTGAVYSTHQGSDDAFVAKVDVGGRALEWSTFVGGSGKEYAYALAVDPSGNAYLTGFNYGGTFPITDGSTFSGNYDVFITKVLSGGGSLGFSGLVGGSGSDTGKGIVVTPFGDVYIAGLTSSSDMTWSGSTFKGGSYDAMVFRYGDGTISSPPLSSSVAWTSQATPSVTDIYEIDFADELNGWAVGKGGVVYATTDGGVSWAAQSSGTSYHYLYGVSAVDASTVWIVGSGGRILKTTDGGGSWSTQTSGVSSTLMGVGFADASTGWAVGSSGTILKTTNGGSTWSAQSSGTTVSLYAISVVDANTAYAVGMSGKILKTTSGGSTWSSQTSGTTWTLSHVSFVDGNTGWVVGSSGKILKTTNGGSTWSTQTSGSIKTLYAVATIDSNNAWVVGSAGTILKTTNGGSTWSTEPSVTTATLYSIASIYSSGKYVWAAGSSVLLRTTTGGWGMSGWSATALGWASANALSFVDINRGWSVREGGDIYVTNDGGVSWTYQANPTMTLYDVTSIDALTAWAAGWAGKIVKTADGGATWIQQTTGTTSALYGIQFVDSNTGWAVGSGGTILKTTDGGSTWSAQSSGTTVSLYAISVVDANHAYVVGDSGMILMTAYGGTSWVSKTSGTTSSLWDVVFVDSSIGYAVGSSGKILKTTNGGSTWSAQTSGTTYTLSAVSAVDANTAWVVGHFGKILKTTDGGVTWQTQTSGTSEWLKDVQVLDANYGWVAGHYVTLRTTTGGQ